MSTCLRITTRFLDSTNHARNEEGDPEWPPSPLRLFQALVAAAAARWNERTKLTSAAPALRWLERLPPPRIIAPIGSPARTSYRLYVPDNVGDKVAASWSRGGNATIADYRTEKDVRPTRLPSSDCAVHYLWSLPEPDPDLQSHFEVVAGAARSVTHLGWGVDMVTACATLVPEADVASLRGDLWRPTIEPSSARYRVPRRGTLDALTEKHLCFINRIGPEGFQPVPPLTSFDLIGYQRATEPAQRPFAAFGLLTPDGAEFRPFDTAHRGLTVAAMLRHAASSENIAQALGWPSEKVATFVLGHGEPVGQPHSPVLGPRIGFVPVPTIEHRGRDRAEVVGAIRRSLVVGFGGGAEEDLQRLARILSGAVLFAEGHADPVVLLSRIPNSDRTVQRYTGSAETWATVTPVVLPGYDDPRKLRRRLSNATAPTDAPEQKGILTKLDRRIDHLIRKAVRQAGYSDELAECAELEWRGSGFWPGTDLATRYGVTDNLRRFRRLHVRIRWRNATGQPVPVPGPICLGGGRFQGLGLFARL